VTAGPHAEPHAAEPAEPVPARPDPPATAGPTTTGPAATAGPPGALAGSGAPGGSGAPPGGWARAELAAVDPAAVPVDPAAPLLNVANALTALRLLLVPVFAAVTIVSDLSHPGWRITAALTFGVASTTDYVDGWVARRHNLVTAFGKIADPIADKALIGTALVLLSLHEFVPWWMTGLILVREVGITVLRFGVLRHGVIPASPGGKVKTLLQSLAIGWLLWPLPAGLAQVGLWLAYAATAVTVGTGIDYVVRAMRLRRVAAR
jgi:CDP-diacylglycerol--glycerol-3-phosphate 3-phosphatidyltransferase